MTTDQALAAINESLKIQAAVTHKGDEVKCYVDGDKEYLTADECSALSEAFATLQETLSGGPDR